MSGVNALQGQFFDGRAPLGAAATLVLGASEAALIGATVSQRYKLRALRVSPRIAGRARFVALPDGAQFHCADDARLDRLPQEDRTEGVIAWLEQWVAVAVAGIALVAGVVTGGYLYGLPWAAEKVAARVPVEAERALGREAIEWLDGKSWLKPSRLSFAQQQELREGFAVLAAGLPIERDLRLEFRDGGPIGANALALPGGTIVVTDQLVKLAASREEVLAVLAHEIGHVERRHALRNLLQSSALAAAAAAVTADAATLSAAIAGAPVLLAQMSYSRDFEREADEYAFALLKRRGFSPEAFASIIGKLSAGEPGAGNPMGFLSTHPVSDERIARAREAAR